MERITWSNAIKFQSQTMLLTRIAVNGIIHLCEKLTLYVSNAARNLPARNPVKAGRLFFAHESATENPSPILKNVYVAAMSFITTQINIFVQWNVQENISVVKVFLNLIAKCYQSLTRAYTTARSIRDGKAMMSVMAHCMSGYIVSWAHQWYASTAGIKNQTINKFIGPIKAVIISAQRMIGLGYAFNVIRNTIKADINKFLNFVNDKIGRAVNTSALLFLFVKAVLCGQ